MAETLDAIQSAMTQWHIQAANKVQDVSALRTSMQKLAADIDSASSGSLSAGERSRLRGQLERMVHDVGEPQVTQAAASATRETGSTIDVFA